MLLVTVTLWALNFSVSKYILDHGFTPLTYSATRYSIAILIFLAIVLAWEGTLRIRRRDLAIVAGAVALLLTNQLSFVFALDLSTATTVALLFGTLPIFTALIARIVGIQRTRQPLLDRGRSLLQWRRARHGRLGRRALGEPARKRAGRPRSRDLGRVLRRACPAHAALLAVAG